MARLLDRLGTRTRNTTRNPNAHAADSTSQAATMCSPNTATNCADVNGSAKLMLVRTHIAISFGHRLPPDLSSQGIDRRDLKGMQLALIAADRNVFAGRKGMHAEPVSRLVIVGAAVVVVEHPARVLGAARLVDETADLLVLAVPEPADAAMLAVFLPELRIDMPLAVERSDELVAVARRAGRKFLERARCILMRLSTCGRVMKPVLRFW